MYEICFHYWHKFLFDCHLVRYGVKLLGTFSCWEKLSSDNKVNSNRSMNVVVNNLTSIDFNKPWPKYLIISFRVDLIWSAVGETKLRLQNRYHLIRCMHTVIVKPLSQNWNSIIPFQFKQAQDTAVKLDLDGIVVIGGDDSNTNACLLAENFRFTHPDSCTSDIMVSDFPLCY